MSENDKPKEDDTWIEKPHYRGPGEWRRKAAEAESEDDD